MLPRNCEKAMKLRLTASHQQHDEVAAVEEDADHADGEEDRSQHQIMV
jgi:hypothetical protein